MATYGWGMVIGGLMLGAIGVAVAGWVVAAGLVLVLVGYGMGREA